MTSRRADDDRPTGDATPTGGRAAADADREHDEVTSREAYEREMAEQGRSDEAGRRGEHID